MRTETRFLSGRTRNHAGFTLIELLVVIAIISILAGILFPVFAKARERARAVACLNNLSQLGRAILMYEGDYGDRFPPAGPTAAAPVSWSGVSAAGLDIRAGALFSYVKSEEVYVCSSDPNSSLLLSYAMSSTLSLYPSGQVDSPTETVMLLDSVDKASTTAAATQDGVFTVDPSVADTTIVPSIRDATRPAGIDAYSPNHNEGANAYFVDGHVRSFRKGELTAKQFRPFAAP